jgi:selenocysteine lyase/cysteine desulfurase
MIDWKEIRRYFPAASNFTYLNPAGGAPMSAQAVAEGKRFYDEMLTGGDTFWDEWLDRKEEVRKKLAKFINADAEEMAFTLNTSHGMSQVAAMLEGRGEVITMHDEFPSSTYPWLHRGFKLNFVKPVDGIYRLKDIENAITPETRILVSSYVQYNSGFRQDLDALGDLCKRKNLIFVVNATQGIGSMPIDVKQTKADFLVFTCLKWTLAGYGIGGLFINKKWFGQIKFPAAGWRSDANPEHMDNQRPNLKTDASETEVGCPHFPCIFALGGALDLLKDIGQEEIFNRILELNSYLEKKLKENNLQIASVLDKTYRSGITVVRINNAKEIVEKLREKKIIVSARGEGIRISVHIFNNFDDIDKLVTELKAIISA